MPSLRKELGKVLVELGKEYRNLVVITGDLGKSTGVSAFETFAERYFNLGISEQDIVGTAAGLASAGKIPVVSTYAVFLAGRSRARAYPSLKATRTRTTPHLAKRT